MTSSITSFFTSFLSTVQAEADTEKPAAAEETSSKESTESEATAEEGEAEPEPEAEAAEEEEEPEDLHPEIRAECQSSSKCASLAKHFEHCQEKVHAGEGFKGEDCVEEIMMHCVDDCAAPKLFAKLR